jgi:hypothetical protein
MGAGKEKKEEEDRIQRGYKLPIKRGFKVRKRSASLKG